MAKNGKHQIMDADIEAYVAYMHRRRFSPNTIRKRGPLLHRMDRQLPCGLVRANATEIEAWLYRDEFSDWTLATYFYHVAGFFDWATDPRTELLDFNPMTMLDKPSAEQGLPRPVTDAQLARILAGTSGEMLLAAKLAAYEGMRCVEIARADREHIDEQNTRIPVGKGKRPGIVPTHPIVWDAVKDLPPGPLLKQTAGGRWNEHQVSQAGCRVLTKLLGEIAGLHRLRHWFGTTTYRMTRDLRRTQELMRHKSPNSTIIYTLVDDVERAEAIASLPQLIAV